MKNDYSNLEKIVNADIKKSNHNAFNKIKLLLNDISLNIIIQHYFVFGLVKIYKI